MRIVLVALMCVTSAFGQGAGQIQFRDWKAPAATAKPKVSCASLRGLTNYEISILSARTVPASNDVPEHCRVSLMIQPAMNVEVNLPAVWNGRFYMFGNGGFAGESFESPGRVTSRARALKAGFAVAATDTGHSAAKEPGGTFARNRQELLDFGFRSMHLTAETGKMLVRAYYGAGPSKSYYDGCSQGGLNGAHLCAALPHGLRWDRRRRAHAQLYGDHVGTGILAADNSPPRRFRRQNCNCWPTQSIRSATPKTA